MVLDTICSVLPNRPRSHVLADEALDAFRVRFRPWVIRSTETNDYGIDAEVEIFDLDGSATGLTFKAQIKGTDLLLRRSVGVSVKISTLNYWASQDVPVLVFYYLAKTGTSYIRWSHAYLPSLTKSTGGNSPSRIRFNFESSDLVDERTRDRILGDVIAIRGLKSRAASGPIPMRVSVRSDSGLSESERARLLAFYVRVVSRLPTGFVYEYPGDSPAGVLAVDKGQFVWSMPANLTSVTVPHGLDLTSVEDKDYVADQVMASAAISLSGLGFDTQATALWECREHHQIIALDPMTISLISGSYLKQGRVESAIDIVLPMFEAADNELNEAGAMLMVPIIMQRLQDISPTAVDRVLVALDRFIVTCSYEHSRKAAQISYLRANILKSRLRHESAIAEFNRTTDLDRSYLARGYFHREIGGCFADLERWFEAAACYSKSKTCRDRPDDIDFVHADALLHCGDFAAALEIVASQSQDEPSARQRLALVGEVAILAVEYFDVTVIHRSQLKTSACEEYSEASSVSELRQAVAASDPLDVRLIAMIMFTGEVEDMILLSRLCLTSAWENKSATAWVFALMSFLDREDFDSTLPTIAEYCIRCESEIARLDDITDGLEDILQADDYAKMMALLYSARAGLSRAQPVTLRMIDESDGDIVAFQVAEPPLWNH